MKNIKIVTYLLLTFLNPVIIHAAEEAHHSFTFSDWFWRIINFAILVAILLIFAGKPFRNFLKQRREGIEKAIEEARQARELAEKALKEIEERYAQKDREIESLLNTAKKAGKIEKEKIIEEGKIMSSRIIEEAKEMIDLEKKRAIESLKREAALLSVELAEKRLLEELTDEKKRKILEDSIKSMEERKR